MSVGRWLMGCAAALALAGGAHAKGACPTAADAGRPIALSFADGYVEVHYSGDGQLWQIDVFDHGEQVYQFEVAHGTHLLRFTEYYEEGPDYGGQARYNYGMEIAGMPIPTPGGRWSVDVEVTDGTGVFAEAQTQAYGALTTTQIGSRTYDVIPVLIAYDDDEQYVEMIYYLPELRLGYLVDSHSATSPSGPIYPVGIEAR